MISKSDKPAMADSAFKNEDQYPLLSLKAKTIHLLFAFFFCISYLSFGIYHRFTNNAPLQEVAVVYTTFYVLLPTALGYILYLTLSLNPSKWRAIIKQTLVAFICLLMLWLIGSIAFAIVLTNVSDCVKYETGIAVINYKASRSCAVSSSVISFVFAIGRIPLLSLLVYIAQRKILQSVISSKHLSSQKTTAGIFQSAPVDNHETSTQTPASTLPQSTDNHSTLITNNPKTYIGYAAFLLVVFGNALLAALDRITSAGSIFYILTIVMNVVVFPVFAIIDRKKSFHFSLPYLIAFLSTLNFLRGVTESINSSRLNQTSSVSLLPISIQITIFISFYSVLCEFLSIRMTSLRHYRSFLILFQMIKWTITANTVSLFADVAGVYVLVAQICIEFLTFMVRNFRYKKLFLWVKMRVNMNKGTTQNSNEDKVTFVSCLDYELLAQEYIVQMFARFTIILRVTADTSIGSELVRPKLLCKAGYQFYFYHLAYEAISIFIMSLSFWIVTKKLYPTLKLRIGVGKVLKKIDVVMVLVFVVSFAYVLEGSFQLRCF